MVRILWASNYTSHSAYSSQSRLAVSILRSLGHDVAVLNLSEGSSAVQYIDGVIIYPTARDPLGNDTLAYYAELHQAEAVITLIDAFGIQPETYSNVLAFPYTPIDHAPIPPAALASLRRCERPIAMSKWGYIQMQQAGLSPFYAPHCFDPETFYPTARSSARQALGWDPDAFIVLFVGVNDSNPSRKGIGELLLAWKAFSKRHPDAALFLHTSEYGNIQKHAYAGIHIGQMISTLGLQNVGLIDQGAYYEGLPPLFLNYLYNAANCLILPSRGEGFGVPVIEAQACGCPVLVTAFGAQDELSASRLRIQGESEWSPYGSLRYRPSVMSIVQQLELAYDQRDDTQAGQEAIDFAQQYASTLVTRHWQVTLAGIQEHLNG